MTDVRGYTESSFDNLCFQRGFNHSHLVGLFLKKRYVDSGFLNKSLVNHEVYLYSSNRNSDKKVADEMVFSSNESCFEYRLDYWLCNVPNP